MFGRVLFNSVAFSPEPGERLAADQGDVVDFPEGEFERLLDLGAIESATKAEAAEWAEAREAAAAQRQAEIEAIGRSNSATFGSYTPPTPGPNGEQVVDGAAVQGDLANASVKELRAIAKAHDVELPAKATKAEVVAALVEAGVDSSDLS